MKIIFSRKGFDSSYGGGASPIMPNGDLVSIPIPCNDKENGIPYSSLRYGNQTYLELMEILGMKVPYSNKCHFDPDLIHGACEREKGWYGVFGQHQGALTHLENQGVSKGDTFLFYGSFRRTHFSENLIFERDYERHIIFGYLRVGEILACLNDYSEGPYLEHPHIKNSKLYGKLNTLYVATGSESFGTFKYGDQLVLTRNGFPKSIWELPDCFNPRKTTISYHNQSRFQLVNGNVTLSTVGQGQDFVVDANHEIIDWTESIISNSKKFDATS